jgi:hypothetical protein
MDKTTLETFIKKYNLNGLLEKVRWVVKDKTLRVTAMTSDKKFLTSITQKKFEGVDDTEFGIIESSTLKKNLGGIADNMTLTVISDPNDVTRVLQFVLEDGNNEFLHQCGALDCFDPEPKIKQVPNYDVEITLTDEFVARFLKAKAAFEGDLFTLVMNKKKQKLEMVLGYHERNLTNRISLNIPVVAGKDTLKSAISFSSKNLKEVLIANSECKDPVLKVSEAGLAFIEFDTPEFQSQYYMIKIDVED